MTPETKHVIIARVEEVRKALGHNKSRFSAEIGMKPQTYANFIGAQGSKPNVELLHGLVTVYGVSPLWLLTGGDTMWARDAKPGKDWPKFGPVTLAPLPPDLSAERLERIERGVAHLIRGDGRALAHLDEMPARIGGEPENQKDNRHPTQCPHCGSDLYGAGETFGQYLDVEKDGKSVWQEVRCLRCDATWNELYAENGIDEFVPPENQSPGTQEGEHRG